MKPTRPLYDHDGRIIARVAATAMRHDHRLIAECPKHHLYLIDAVSLKRGAAPECPLCGALAAEAA